MPPPPSPLPPSPTRQQTHYSGSNRIPTIHQYLTNLDRDKSARDAEIDATLRASNRRHSEVRDHMPVAARAAAAVEKVGDTHRRTVRDPVTGGDVEIEDVDGRHVVMAEEPMDLTSPPDPVAPCSTSDVPIHGEKTNVLFHPTPSVTFEPAFALLEARARALSVGVFLAVALVGASPALGGGDLRVVVPLAGAVAAAVWVWAREVVSAGRAGEWKAERVRGRTAVVNLIPESVEWLNTVVGLVWGLVNPEVFSAVADTLEDVMQASLPGVVEHVKVNDISQGSNPLRILSLRALPEKEVQEMKDEIHRQAAQEKDPEELAAEEEGRVYYNLEASVAYHSLPSSADVSSKAKNMGMQLVFYLGIRGLFGVPFPVWVELNRLVATTRLRVSLAPDPPFVKTVSFTLMGLPKVEASCVPLVQHGTNILNLPLISNFVNWAIGAVAGMYVAPKSMTVEVGKLLQGDDIKKDTNALGVLFVNINRATGLSKQDRHGSEGGGSDPYVCVSFSKFSKPLYCTRVIEDDLNPIFEECCPLLVTADVIRADEHLALELWDSDRSSADDVVGRVQLSIQKLLQHPGRMFPQVSALKGVKAGSNMPGELHWEVGYFGKTQFRPALRTDGHDARLLPELRGKKELQNDPGRIETAEEAAVVVTPPDPLWPSGILSVVVHQIVNLELANVKGSRGGRRTGGREYEPARDDTGEVREEEGRRLPSAYCTVLVNDELVYKTRTKVVSSRPIFEAGTERFVRDWRSCIVTVSVRDARNRQHDPLLGVVPLRLSEELQTSSQTTRWYPIDGGIGFGRIRVSLLFRSVEVRLPATQLGFGDIGTFEFTSDAITTARYCPSERVKIRLRTGGSSATVRSAVCRRTGEGDDAGLSWDISGAEGSRPRSRRIRLPVRFRYRSAVVFEFRQAGRARRRKADTFASLWLQDVADFDEREFDLPVWRCDKGMRLSQNYITAENVRSVPDLRVDEIGRVRFRGRFKPGTDRDHVRFVSDNDSRETIESWEACFAEGVREEHVKPEVPPIVRRLHEESLTRGRDVLDMASEEEKRKWLAGDAAAVRGETGAEVGGESGGVDAEERREEPGGELAGEPAHGSGDSGSAREVCESSSSSTASCSSKGAAAPCDDEEVDLGIEDATHDGHEGEHAKEDDEEEEEDEGDGEEGDGEGNDEGCEEEEDEDEGNYTWRRSSSSANNGRSLSAESASTPRSMSSMNPVKQLRDYRSRSRDLHRKQRGLMQWKPMRNAQFAKDEALFAARRLMRVGSLTGRKPDVETEV
ncbi:hypothetical protein C8A05DRAFT_44906 [Staphylotrichum tortipilum]|uniref:Uncharacterized protein n=1 Tax=Staphylotrichum tortipilum TaxID=2831512 RepID=A0AAN6MJR0_9PEZI|nr:hypothetical protein C8A05DRAFT_44906 [Staphylotrichum longicolle]